MLNAQVKFKNQTNQQPVSNVTLLSSDGKIMGRSDIYGNLNPLHLPFGVFSTGFKIFILFFYFYKIFLS